MTLADLERRLEVAERKAAARVSEPQRRRNSVARFEQERAKALADPNVSALKRARLTANGAGMSASALATLAGVSRDTLSRAEASDPRVSAAVWRRLATALDVRVGEIRP